MTDTSVVYIHGFNSSPKSVKAAMVADYLQQHYPNVAFHCPQLPHYPKESIALLEELIKQNQSRRLCFIGSSLGGYLATYLVNNYGGQAVLINPAVAPYDLFKDYLGPQLNPYTRTRYELKMEHLRELIELDSRVIKNPQDFWVLAQTEDEVLDFRLAQEKYRQCKLTIEQGGDHSFQGFERYLNDIVQFFKIA